MNFFCFVFVSLPGFPPYRAHTLFSPSFPLSPSFLPTPDPKILSHRLFKAKQHSKTLVLADLGIFIYLCEHKVR